MKVKYYYMQNCPHCEKVIVEMLDKYKVEKVDIHSSDYDGFVPDQVPILQAPGLTLVGPNQINAMLNLIDYATKAK